MSFGSLACSEARNVSLISLIANPEKFDQKCIWVSGYLHTQFEDSRLYLSKEHADRLFTENSIWVDGTEGELNAKWVSLRGVFNFNEKNNFLPLVATSKVVLSEQVFDGSKRLTER
ncbi:hypothetical protein [Pseudoalteromonas phenolica]|uniref:Uncharacterized protein n=1 Tax=Pseudoalteromonas phenolica TaxID=161398 RepID=A0A0S2K7B5_9GAMM|nr:hypothetical protein [Pseudoalteromonas phenolica]ALO44314.1 hypothetical protein PP2015_3845 [Pseudoalteromonas phenolica]MBE0357313.1 hypothetical protein [Pseudoalteromonas phenolica O-BC30]